MACNAAAVASYARAVASYAVCARVVPCLAAELTYFIPPGAFFGEKVCWFGF